jgi:hypothetical protein
MADADDSYLSHLLTSFLYSRNPRGIPRARLDIRVKR